jgi:soluble lytic murein transglycosylase
MQIMPGTGKFLARMAGLKWTSAEDILFDPVINIRLGCHYLSHLIELYEVDGGLAAYNGGGQKAALWLSKGRARGVLYQETQNYVPAVLALYDEFKN